MLSNMIYLNILKEIETHRALPFNLCRIMKRENI